jgi:hypothetical protein
MVNLCFQPFNKRKNRRVIFVKMAKKKKYKLHVFCQSAKPNCEIRVFHSGYCKYFSFLGYDAVYSRRQIPTFREKAASVFVVKYFLKTSVFIHKATRSFIRAEGCLHTQYTSWTDPYISFFFLKKSELYFLQ